MGTPWNTWSILHDIILIILFLHQITACNARMWRMMRKDTQEVAEVVHLSSSRVQYRRHLQTGSYCVAVANGDPTQLQAALDWACGSGQGQGNVDCSPLQVGGSCYQPDTIQAHASYAFNAYYVSQNAAVGSCNFNGLATLSQSNPSSSSSCVYQSLTGSNSNTTSPGTPPSSGTPPSPFSTSPPTNNTGTIFSPPTDNTTTGITNFAPLSFNAIPSLYALYGGILLIAVL